MKKKGRYIPLTYEEMERNLERTIQNLSLALNEFKNVYLTIIAAALCATLVSCEPEKNENPDIDLPDTFTLVTEGMADLGLSVKWATCNIGAEKPEEYGDYYAWGEVEVRDESTYKNNMWEHYAFGSAWAGAVSLTKYCTNPKYGIEDHNTILDPEDDVASVKLGDKWRMPTSYEMQELKRECEQKPYEINGTKGILFIGHNKNAIFLPLAGGVLGFQNVNAYYWTSSLCLNDNTTAMALNTGVISIDHGAYLETTAGRVYGLPVRAVYGDAPRDGYEVEFSSTSISGLTTTSATVSSKVSVSSGKIETAGFCYSTGDKLVDVLHGNVANSEIGANGVLETELSDLLPSTTYRVRPFVEIESVRYYGDIVEFNSQNETVSQVVDLGLSVKWASWNLGASKPEETGDFYAWAETTPRTNFKEDAPYPYWDGSKFTKYSYSDKKSVLEATDDAATVQWGEPWRIPTIDEWNELLENCNHEKHTRNGVDGYLFTSKINGNQIFFPFTGLYYKSDEIVDQTIGKRACYPSRNIHLKTGVNIDKSYAYFHCPTMDDEKIFFENISFRVGTGLTVRAVLE